MSSTPWTRNYLDDETWKLFWYTKFTTARTALMTPILVTYIFTILRLAGTRTLTHATLYNKIVLVAVGTLVGSVALRPNSPLTSVVIATLIIVGTALLVDTAYAMGWLPATFVHARPTLLYANDQMLMSNLRRCLLSAEKLRSEVRTQGHSSLAEVFAVKLEPTGSFAVITKDAANKSDLSLLHDVHGYEQHLKHLAAEQAELQGPVKATAAAPAGADGVQHVAVAVPPTQQ